MSGAVVALHLFAPLLRKSQSAYEFFVAEARKQIDKVETGRFQAMMDVELSNDGPVTILLDSEKLF
jgi:D-tyrosyl-tRNA(Tyr) deacylase